MLFKQHDFCHRLGVNHYPSGFHTRNLVLLHSSEKSQPEKQDSVENDGTRNQTLGSYQETWSKQYNLKL